jgi:hypothetical protein
MPLPSPSESTATVRFSPLSLREKGVTGYSLTEFTPGFGTNFYKRNSVHLCYSIDITEKD